MKDRRRGRRFVALRDVMGVCGLAGGRAGARILSLARRANALFGDLMGGQIPAPLIISWSKTSLLATGWPE